MPSKSLTFLQQSTTNGQGCFYERSPAWRSQPTVLVPVELKHAAGKEHSPDAGTFKQGSRPSASLLRSSKSCTSGESISSLEPKLRLLLKSKSPKPLALGPKDDFCQHIIATIWKGGKGPEHEGEDDKDDKDKHNLGIPDMLVQCETQDAEFHPLWPFEISFSQSSEAAEAKIQLFADKNPHVEGGTHFHIAEAQTHMLPSDEWVMEQELNKKKVGHIKQVTITMWLRPPNGRLRTTNRKAQYYASMVLFPQQDTAGLQNIQHLFRCTLQRVCDSMVWHLEGEHPPHRNDPHVALIKPLKQWTVPDTVVWDACVDGLETAVKQTAFRRYHKWHENFLKCTIDEVEDAEDARAANSNKQGRRH
ncbi:uncharacterized protein F5147DRAFT_657709 [Suillus discolor]|uniref:Uncharacterized protein n=1 Tax=Suillus discolor TaxID=1912936 RepID=A0A9P7EWL2_9AGAM|nr:uncharacterized protein F5147DRAFT_657709 [Suillus discolor]KAG2092297.1 hypothetical protein F5147DRAFT_657709 [Suillus discolor]